jgi:hypothetical protein
MDPAMYLKGCIEYGLNPRSVLLASKCQKGCAIATTIDRTNKLATYKCEHCGTSTTQKLGETG